MKTILIILALSVVGCAGNNANLQAEIATLKQKSIDQDKQIADLKEKNKSDIGEDASKAWAWIKTQSGKAWDSASPTVNQAEDKFKRCWEEMKK